MINTRKILVMANSIRLLLKRNQILQQQLMVNSRGKHRTTVFSSSQSPPLRNYEEIRIPVPWGHLAGKWWGPQDKRPILCLHGWQESCGSFDPLVSLLPDDVSLLAFDFPGHGYSSRLPKGVYYHGVDAPVLVRRIHKYFEWSKVSLLGHSLGGITSFMYACLYPNAVDMLIQIDALKPFSKEPGGAIESTVENIDKFLKYDALNDAKTNPPAYTYDEMCQLLHTSTRKSVSIDSCKYILQRIIQKADGESDKYVFSRDNRLKVGVLVGIQHVDLLEYAKRIKCPHLVLKSKNSTYFEDKRYVYEVVDVLKANNTDFEYLKIEGTHHVHINEPERVANIINRFLTKYNSVVDRSVGGIKEEMRLKN